MIGFDSMQCPSHVARTDVHMRNANFVQYVDSLLCPNSLVYLTSDAFIMLVMISINAQQTIFAIYENLKIAQKIFA